MPANPGTSDSYELHVAPQGSGEPNDYFLNSRTGADQTMVIRLDYAANDRSAGRRPPPTFTQPFQAGANIGRGQWVYIDVTDVVARP